MAAAMPLPIEAYPTTYVSPAPVPMTAPLSYTQQSSASMMMGSHSAYGMHSATAGMEYNYEQCPCETCLYYSQQYAAAAAAAAAAASSGYQSTNSGMTHQASTYQHNPYASAYSYTAPYTPGSENAVLSTVPTPQQQQQHQQPLMHPSNMSLTVGNGMPLQQISQNMYNAYGNSNIYGANAAYNTNNAASNSAYRGCYDGNSMMVMNGCAPSVNVGCGDESLPVAYSLAEQFNSVIGMIVPTACSTRGRSLLQSVMRLQQADKTKMIFDELMMDPRTSMLDANGCHVVRSLVEVMDESQVKMMVAKITPDLLIDICTASQYTRRILQALFERNSTASLEPIVDMLAVNSLPLAGTQQGCIALMRVVERCSESQKSKLLDVLCPKLGDLAFDPFGNYVVQSVLEHCRGERIAAAFKGKLQQLAKNKFASNAMEKLFRFSSPQNRSDLLHELLDIDEQLTILAADGFGNFVIQAIIDTCTDATEYKWIAERVRSVLHSSAYGHKIESKLRAKKLGNGTVTPQPQNSRTSSVDGAQDKQ